jgi:hypothetical protein
MSPHQKEVSMLRDEQQARGPRIPRAVMMYIAAAALLGAIALLGPIDILQGALCGKGCSSSGLGTFVSAINSVKGPANAAIASLSGLGILLGGAMWAIAHEKAGRTLAMAGGTVLVVLLGNGVVL